uniref:Zinc finger PHD-type domain-containing protein n=1 Tax=Heliothis virescens TaxID=7102 RepID=A0A2A4JUE7_HELVI
MDCSKCKDVVVEGVLCSQCQKHLHYSCSGVQETTYRKMTAEKRDNWRCVDCRTSGLSPTLSDVLKELKSLRSSFDELKADVNIVKTSVEDMTTQWKDIICRVESMEGRLDCVEQTTSKLASLHRELQDAKTTIAELTRENNSREQYSRMNNAEISGIPWQKGENLVSILSNIYTKVGLSLELRDINRIHRVRRFEQEPNAPSRPPAIIVQFIRQGSKDQLLAAIRSRRGISTADIGFTGPAANIYVSDHLTPTYKLLLKRSRELKEQCGFKYLWVRDCKIFMRKSDSSKVIRISSDKDLSNIK